MARSGRVDKIAWTTRAFCFTASFYLDVCAQHGGFEWLDGQGSIHIWRMFSYLGEHPVAQRPCEYPPSQPYL